MVIVTRFCFVERSLWQRADAFILLLPHGAHSSVTELLKVYSSWWAQYPPTSADSLVLRMKDRQVSPINWCV